MHAPPIQTSIPVYLKSIFTQKPCAMIDTDNCIAYRAPSNLYRLVQNSQRSITLLMISPFTLLFYCIHHFFQFLHTKLSLCVRTVRTQPHREQKNLCKLSNWHKFFFSFGLFPAQSPISNRLTTWAGLHETLRHFAHTFRVLKGTYLMEFEMKKK